MKFVDASGDNVWWVKKTGYEFPVQWTPVRYKKRHISKAWGPSPDRVLRHSAQLEFTIYNRVGGKGAVCFDALRLERLAPADHSPLKRSEEHTSELQSLMRISYAVFCLKTKKKINKCEKQK